MITEKDLLEAIAECQGERNPNANTCIKLAAFYTILDHVREPETGYSYSPPPPTEKPAAPVVSYRSESEFSRAVDGMEPERVWPVVDELMETLRIINPRLYRGVLRQLEA